MKRLRIGKIRRTEADVGPPRRFAKRKERRRGRQAAEKQRLADQLWLERLDAEMEAEGRK